MPIPAVALAISRGASTVSKVGGRVSKMSMVKRAAKGGAPMSGTIGHVEDMTAAYISDAKDLVEKAILAGGYMVQRETKILLSKNKGKKVTRNRATGRFQKEAVSRSKPGEVPFLQTGELRKSISVEGARTLTGEFFAKVGSVAPTDKYAIALEFGAPANNLKPRPYLRPAFDNTREAIGKLIGEAVKAASSGGKGGGSIQDPITGRFMSGGG
tara:strand:- start:224 stop:862 length:639 start_codon:yes stop_codon:yes gene_type:complete